MTNDFVQSETELNFTIRVSVRGGIGNRILGLLSALVVSEELKANLEIVWEPDSHCPAPFEALFQSIGIAISTEKVDDESWPQRSIPTRDFFRNGAKKAKIVEIRPNPIFGEDLFSPDVFKERIRTKFALLQPASAVGEIMKSTPKSAIGIHVRMTDHLACQLLTPRWCYRLAVEQAVASGITDPILVCSDTPEFFEELQKISRGNLVRLTSPFTSSAVTRTSAESIQYALADLLLLASCEVILASSDSSFARLAHIVGRNELFVLNGLPHILRSRQSNIAWWFAALCELDPKRGRWVRAKRANWVSGLLGIFCAKLIVSRVYQDHPLPHLRTRNRQYLRGFFKARNRKAVVDSAPGD